MDINQYNTLQSKISAFNAKFYLAEYRTGYASVAPLKAPEASNTARLLATNDDTMHDVIAEILQPAKDNPLVELADDVSSEYLIIPHGKDPHPAHDCALRTIITLQDFLDVLDEDLEYLIKQYS